MNLNDAIQDYFRFIQHEQGVTQATLETYKSWLRHFARWLETNGYPQPGLDAFNLPTLRRFLYDLSGRGYRPRTIRGIFHPLRSFGAFLVTNGVIETNPAKQVTTPHLDAAERKTVSDEEIALLLAACERQRTKRQIALARAVLSVFVYGGLRRSEACNLKVKDIDIREGSVHVRQGKGQKSRTVYVCKECVRALSEWLAVREQDCQADWLFMFDRKRRIHEVGLRTLMQTIIAHAGLRDHDNIQVHALRHAAATRLLRNGADLRSIQTFLGHSNLQVTSVYLHTDEAQARSIAELGALKKTEAGPQGGEVIRLPIGGQGGHNRSSRLRRIAR